MSYNCPKCGNGFEKGTKFCKKCGYDLAVNFIEEPVCPICNKSYPPNTKHCIVDGNALVRKEELMPKCEICNKSYAADVKFCPIDGGQVKASGKIRINLIKKSNPDEVDNNIPIEYEQSTQEQFDYNYSYTSQPENYNYEFSGYPKASLGSRFGASMIDGLITVGLCIPAFFFLFAGIAKSSSYYSRGAGKFYFFAVIFYLIPLTYNFIKDGLGQGQSIGKKSLGLMVVNLDDNTPCTKGKSFFRNFISSLVSAIPYVGWMIEPIMALATADGRKLGDKAANTQVIEKSEFRPSN